MAFDWEQDLAQTSTRLCEVMEQHALPPVESIVDYVQHQQRPPYLYLSQGQALETSPIATFTVALGECSVGAYDAAEKRLAAILQPSPLDPHIEVSKYCPHVRGRIRYFLPILREERTKVLPLLHDWEEHAVKGMKLTKYWKPTPFPAEM